MTFKFYSFVPGDDSELNYARPGSPPAFFSLPSPVSPRMCGNCIPSITAGAVIAASTAGSTLKDGSLQPVDAGLHDLRSRVMSALSVPNEVQELSLDSLKEVTDCILDLNQEVVKVILDWVKDSWKNQELSDIANGYYRSTLQILDFCSALGKCLDRARDTQLSIQVALQQFDKEDGTGGGQDEGDRYRMVLQDLRRFRVAVDHFTGELYQIFQTIIQQKIQMYQNLRLQDSKLDKTLRLSKPLWRNFEKAVVAQREVMRLMQISIYTGNSDLVCIKATANYLEVRIESLMQATEIFVVEEIRKNLNLFRDKLDELNLHAERCGDDVWREMKLVLQKIIGNPK